MRYGFTAALFCFLAALVTSAHAGMAIKLTEFKPDAIHLSSCLTNAKPDCPYRTAEELAKMLKDKTGVEVILGTHDYP